MPEEKQSKYVPIPIPKLNVEFDLDQSLLIFQGLKAFISEVVHAGPNGDIRGVWAASTIMEHMLLPYIEHCNSIQEANREGEHMSLQVQVEQEQPSESVIELAPDVKFDKPFNLEDDFYDRCDNDDLRDLDEEYLGDHDKDTRD